MKGCFTIQKNKKICAVIALALILSTAIGLAILPVACKMQYDKPPADATEDDSIFPEVLGKDSDGFTAYTQASVSIPAVTGIALESGNLTQTINLSNPSGNTCAFVISLYLADGTIMFHTEPIYPGNTADTVMLSRELSCGHYTNAVLVYDCYSADGAMKPLTRCELVIEITSK